MDFIKIFIFIETLAIICIAVKSNPDIFSPVKFYLIFSIFFYLNIYFQDVSIETIGCYFLIIQAIGLCALLEKKLLSSIIVDNDSNKVIGKIIWILSLPPLFIIGYYIYDAGGFFEYLGILALRVQVWSGHGPLTMIINWLPTLNLVYFGSFLLNKKKSFFDILTYGLHFILFLIIGLLTASRSYIGISILGMAVVWAYLIGIPKIRSLILVGVSLVVFAGYMGAVRNNYGEGMTFDSLGKSLTESNFESAQMSYGIDPLEVIFATSEKAPLLGGTYLTLFTNIIPRSIWANKPDTGGLIFTKEYTDDQSGLSYFATGAITEAVMNFGKLLGVAFGSIQILVFFITGSLVYNKYYCLASKNKKSLSVFFIIGFYYLILSFSKVSYGEFTDVFQALLLFNIFPLVLIRLGLRLMDE